MEKLYVAASLVHLVFRHARTLKDKRQSMQSLFQKLKNEGFSVSEVDFKDDPKQGGIGFSFVSSDSEYAENRQAESRRFFDGDFQVSQTRHELFVIDMEEPTTELPWEEEFK